jgi:hypothetical protein
MPLDLRIELKWDRDRLPKGVKAINEFFKEASFELELVNARSGKRLTVKPYNPTRGMLATDPGKYVLRLDKQSGKPWTVSFPLVLLEDALVPGAWNCQVRFSVPPGPNPWWRDGRQAWDRAGFWSGTIRSQEFRLGVLAETPKTQVFWLPKSLRLEKGLRITYRKEDSEKVTLRVRNGHVLATFVWPGTYIGGALAPGVAVDQWQRAGRGDRKAEYTIEVFQTPDPPTHMWMPRMKVLWHKTLSISATEKEVESAMDEPKGDKK